MSSQAHDPVLEAFLRHLEPARDRIERIILFGSRVRGDEKPYSDYDLLLVVEERERSLMDAIHDAAIEALLATGRLISPKVFRRRDFDRLAAMPTPFFARVLAEGIPIG
jgi:predicted nucleotidyltransferase